MIYPLIRDHHVIRAAHAWVGGGLGGAAGALPALVGVRHIIPSRPQALLRPFPGGRLQGAAHHLRGEAVRWHLPWALHPLSAVRVRVLALQGPALGPGVGAAVLVVHLGLLAAELHVVHVPFVALGGRTIHAVHVALVVLKFTQRQIALTRFSRNNHTSPYAKVITWWLCPPRWTREARVTKD